MSDNKDTKQFQPQRRRGHMGGGRGLSMPVEKPKNFKKTMANLIYYCRSYIPAIVIALILAAIGTVFTIIGPDKLKDMTNEVTVGLVPAVNGQSVTELIGTDMLGIITNALQEQKVTPTINQDDLTVVIGEAVQDGKIEQSEIDFNSLPEILKAVITGESVGDNVNKNFAGVIRTAFEGGKLKLTVNPSDIEALIQEAESAGSIEPSSVNTDSAVLVCEAMLNNKLEPKQINMDNIASIALMLVLFYGSSVILNFTQHFIMATVTQRISKKLRTGISDKINKLPFKYFDKTSYGDVLSRVTNDVDTIGQTLNQSIGMIVTSTTLFFGALIMMFYNNWIMALSAIGSTILGFVLMMFIMKK